LFVFCGIVWGRVWFAAKPLDGKHGKKTSQKGFHSKEFWVFVGESQISGPNPLSQ